MKAHTIRTWYLVHKWTSLVCTLFMLLLCLTGLPLIFHEEIEHARTEVPSAGEMPGRHAVSAESTRLSSRRRRPARRKGPVHVLWDEDEPELVYASLQVPGAPPDEFSLVVATRARAT